VRIARLGLCAVCIAALSECRTADGQSSVFLRHSIVQNVSYLVERKYKWVLDKDLANPPTCHQRAIVAYGQGKWADTGVMLLTPKARVLFDEAKGKKFNREFWPLKAKRPDGRHVDGARWQMQCLAKGYDLFPVFLRRPVRVGEGWRINGKLSYPLTCVEAVAAQIEHRLDALEEVDGRLCAKVSYSLTGALNTADRPEMLTDEIRKMVKPAYTFLVKGVVYFDVRQGIAVRQHHSAKTTCRWTGELDRLTIRLNPHWRQSVDDVYTWEVTTRLISPEEDAQLTKEAEVERLKREQAEAAAAANKREEVEVGPAWKYLVTKQIRSFDKLGERDMTEHCRAFVHYGAGAKKAGGQVEGVPEVVHVDENLKPLAGHVSLRLVAHSPGRLALVAKLPRDMGQDAELPIVLSMFRKEFYIFPVAPDRPFEAGLAWKSTLYVGPWASGLRCPIEIDHRVVGYAERKGMRCVVIKYGIAGRYRSVDHPQSAPESRRKNLRGEYHLVGKGRAYVDVHEGIVVEKEQTVSLRRLGQKLVWVEKGKTGWAPSCDDGWSIQTTVLLVETKGTDAASRPQQR